jgi:hypothetical protein
MNKKEMEKIQGSQGGKGKEKEKVVENTEENTEEVPEEATEVVSPPISRYYQKQYERFMKVTEKKEDIQEAFFESITGEKYEDDTLYTRLKRNPRKRH